MHIKIKTVTTDPFKKVTLVDDGKNTLTIATVKTSLSHTTTTTIDSNGDSIYPIMDLLKILEGVK